MVKLQASKTRSPTRPSIATSVKSNGLAEVRAATIIALNCRCERPSVGDCAGTRGRRTYPAGEAFSTASITCAGFGQAWPCGSVDRPVDPTATEQRLIRRRDVHIDIFASRCRRGRSR
jgi:hypothetical protein